MISARAATTMIAHSVTQSANGTRFRCMFGQIKSGVGFHTTQKTSRAVFSAGADAVSSPAGPSRHMVSIEIGRGKELPLHLAADAGNGAGADLSRAVLLQGMRDRAQERIAQSRIDRASSGEDGVSSSSLSLIGGTEDSHVARTASSQYARARKSWKALPPVTHGGFFFAQAIMLFYRKLTAGDQED